MNALIVWVFGGSAAGKETFIRKANSGFLKELFGSLGWENKKIIISKKSIDYVAQNETDSLGPKRKEIVNEVLKLAKKDNSIILIKGQDLDLENNRLENLRDLLPSNEHIVIYLHADSRTLYARVKRKSWWKKEWSKKEYLKWVKYQIDLLSKLKGFKIISLNSGNRLDYGLEPFPPKYQIK